MRGTVFFLVAVMVAAACTASAGRERVEGIVAVVGDSIILASELEAYVYMRLTGGDIDTNAVRPDSLRRWLLEDLVSDKVFQVHAEKDSAITLSDQEVDEAMDRHIQGLLKENRLTMEQLAEELQRSQGIGLAEFKVQMRKGLRKQLLKQKVLQRYMSSLRLTRSDVEQFYAEYKDSLPTAGESVRLRKLVIATKPSDSLRQAAYERIGKIRERIAEGADFVELAKQFSDDPNAESGGDLGFIAKGTLSELVFEEKAFSLSPGEVSDVFETRIGFHILKAEAKRDQKAHVRQILVRVAPPEREIAATVARLDSVREAAVTSAAFEDAVRRFSTDSRSKARGGDIGWVSVYSLPSAVAQAIDSLAEGGVSVPVKTDDGYAVFRVEKKLENRKYSLEDDWDLISEKAKDIYAQKRLFDLVKKWRDQEFVDIRL